MKRVSICALIIVLALALTACSNQKSERNNDIFEIYNLAVVNAAYEGTYEEWLEEVRGPAGVPGEDGREVELSVSSTHILWRYEGDENWLDLITLTSLIGPQGEQGLRGSDGIAGSDGMQLEIRYSEDYIQWKYEDGESWDNLIAISLITGSNGSDGQDGMEVVFQVSENMLQWKYEDDAVWKDLIIYNDIEDSYYLTDNEINELLDNYVSDIDNLFTGIDLTSLNVLEYDNTCDSNDYEDCNTSDNYPSIFGLGYEKYEDKIFALSVLKYALGGVSNLIGDYESEPIVPGDYTTGNKDFVSVDRNNTSIIFEGNIEGEIPTEIPLELSFGYRLLFYKSIEDNKVYVEGQVDFVGGFFIFEQELANSSFLSTYDMGLNLEDVVYTTDLVGPAEWVSVIQPIEGGYEVFSTNNDSMEYFKHQNGITEIVYSNNWFDVDVEYYYELYNQNQLQYIFRNEDGVGNYEIPFSVFSGWDLVEFTETNPIGENEFLYSISNLGTIIKSDTILETPLITEPTWILRKDFKNYFSNDGELDKSNAKNVIYIETNSKIDLDSFISGVLTYSGVVNFDEYISVIDSINGYNYYNYEENLMNTDEIFVNFNLRD